MNKKYYAVVLLALSVGMIAPAATVSAATQGRQQISSAATDGDTIKPEFATSAEALRAANHAKEAVSSGSTLKQSLANVEKAQNSLNKAVNSKDRDVINRANQALAKAEETYTRDLADITGVSNKDIRAIHDTGMGWGEVAHELGVHPDLVGFDHNRDDAKHLARTSKQSNQPAGIDPDELNEATARNMSSGWSQGHGVGMQSGVHSGSGSTDDAVGISGAGGVRHGVDESGNRRDAHDNKGKDSLSGNLGDLGNQPDSGGHDSRGSGGDSGGSGSGGSGSGGDGGGHGGSGGSGGGSGGSGSGGDGGGHD